ncbi:MarR family winged helix-turn-helix transcriptional regulator [Romboutsia lituseburensis]|uniref:DNA-binding transcriptional regulator, MarR family n=1 Tax=Romboutsia lituseburensis DSM 797 TaxID=1121325 RepID=A0A1G9JE68_9FIRM|nr:MarR family transcriptional regulator [Romboutsia lituseburensis]CEH33527.1 helix_turn_helix multiple antibiotic resistance protein [Romboutsia lituseburensis]SDL35738.1 DNA-binding transcriptional regulator, MarR family [Romboutsia lituseburensis DSM 797]
MAYKILGKYLSDLNRDFIKHIDIKLQEYQLTLNMWRCMMSIQKNKECNLKDIAELLGVDRAIITRNIKKLESLNYISKEKASNDNRFFDLCVTEEGLSILNSINEYQYKWYEKVTKDFNKQESEDLINLLQKLCNNI